MQHRFTYMLAEKRLNAFIAKPKEKKINTKKTLLSVENKKVKNWHVLCTQTIQLTVDPLNYSDAGSCLQQRLRVMASCRFSSCTDTGS